MTNLQMRFVGIRCLSVSSKIQRSPKNKTVFLLVKALTLRFVLPKRVGLGKWNGTKTLFPWQDYQYVGLERKPLSRIAFSGVCIKNGGTLRRLCVIGRAELASGKCKELK